MELCQHQPSYPIGEYYDGFKYGIIRVLFHDSLRAYIGGFLSSI